MLVEQTSRARAYLLAAALLLAATVAWAIVVHAAPRSSAALLVALAPLAATLGAGWLVARAHVVRPGVAAAAVAAGYVIAGVLYALLRRGGQMESFAWKTALWPVLVLWQDACNLGAWPCPVG